MSVQPPGRRTDDPNGLIASVRQQRERRRRWRLEGEPSVARFVGQIGVLGWITVLPTLLGLFVGRWLDQKLGTEIFWSAPLLVIGAALGCWLGWRWMHAQ
jgi:ATP synthase protein I